MSTALHKPMTMTDFLNWEELQPTKHEFDGLQPVAMAGGTRAHAQLQRNLAITIGGALRGSPCEFLGSDFQLHLTTTVRYPDGIVVCDRGNPKDRGTTLPVIVFEVLSPSTAGTDRIAKAQEYQATASVQHYVMLEQDRVGAMVLSRSDQGWTAKVLSHGGVLALTELGIQVALEELYEGVELPNERPD